MTSTKFYNGATPLIRPEDVRPFLGKPDLHWKKGRSAYELAYSWIPRGDFPPEVRAVLDLQPTLKKSEFVMGQFEHQTHLDSGRAPSQTDLLVQAEAVGGKTMITIEAKVDETFGPTIAEWNTGAPGRKARLDWLCKRLEVSNEGIEDLRYQLFHRTVAALIEGEARGARQVVMLVQSFSSEHAHFADFKAFSEYLGAPVEAPGGLSKPVLRGSVFLFLGWCTSPVK